MEFMKVKAIVHRGKPENYEQMILDCARNVRLNKRATKLLMYYAGCNNGFRPALSIVSKETGITSNKISSVRQELISHGLIGYGEEFGDMLIIDWNRIRIFAMLEKPLVYQKKNSENYFSAVQEARHAARNRRNNKKPLFERGRMYKLPGVDEKKDLFLQFFGNMNEQEFIELVTSFPEYDRSKQRNLMTDAEYAKYIDVKAFRLPASYSYTYTAEEQAGYENMIDFLKSAPQGLPF